VSIRVVVTGVMGACARATTATRPQPHAPPWLARCLAFTQAPRGSTLALPAPHRIVAPVPCQTDCHRCLAPFCACVIGTIVKVALRDCSCWHLLSWCHGPLISRLPHPRAYGSRSHPHATSFARIDCAHSGICCASHANDRRRAAGLAGEAAHRRLLWQGGAGCNAPAACERFPRHPVPPCSLSHVLSCPLFIVWRGDARSLLH